MPSFVYQIINLSNGKKYIGKTNDPTKRWSAHKDHAKGKKKHPLYDSMRHHGIENFKFEVIEEFITEDLALAEEKNLISLNRSNDPNFGFNLTDGGEGISGFRFSDEQRKKLSQIQREINSRPEVKSKISASLKRTMSDPIRRQKKNESISKTCQTLEGSLRKVAFWTPERRRLRSLSYRFKWHHISFLKRID